VLRKRRKIMQEQLEYERRSNRLHGLCIDGWKTRAQTFVPPDDFIQRSLHRINLQKTTESHGNGNVVERAGRLQLMKKPETLLCKRKWETLVARYSNDWWSLFACSVTQRGFDLSGEVPDGRLFKQTAYRQLHSEAFTYARDESRRQQRMSAEREKVVAHTDALDPEQLRP